MGQNILWGYNNGQGPGTSGISNGNTITPSQSPPAAQENSNSSSSTSLAPTGMMARYATQVPNFSNHEPRYIISTGGAD